MTNDRDQATGLPLCPKCGHVFGGTMSTVHVYYECVAGAGGIARHTGFFEIHYDGEKETLGSNGRPMLFCGASHVGAPSQQKDGAPYCGYEWEAPEWFRSE